MVDWNKSLRLDLNWLLNSLRTLCLETEALRKVEKEAKQIVQGKKDLGMLKQLLREASAARQEEYVE